MKVFALLFLKSSKARLLKRISLLLTFLFVLLESKRKVAMEISFNHKRGNPHLIFRFAPFIVFDVSKTTWFPLLLFLLKINSPLRALLNEWEFRSLGREGDALRFSHSASLRGTNEFVRKLGKKLSHCVAALFVHLISHQRFLCFYT